MHVNKGKVRSCSALCIAAVSCGNGAVVVHNGCGLPECPQNGPFSSLFGPLEGNGQTKRAPDRLNHLLAPQVVRAYFSKISFSTRWWTHSGPPQPLRAGSNFQASAPGRDGCYCYHSPNHFGCEECKQNMFLGLEETPAGLTCTILVFWGFQSQMHHQKVGPPLNNKSYVWGATADESLKAVMRMSERHEDNGHGQV